MVLLKYAAIPVTVEALEREKLVTEQDMGPGGWVVDWQTSRGSIRLQLLKYGVHDKLMAYPATSMAVLRAFQAADHSGSDCIDLRSISLKVHSAPAQFHDSLRLRDGALAACKKAMTRRKIFNCSVALFGKQGRRALTISVHYASSSPDSKSRGLRRVRWLLSTLA